MLRLFYSVPLFLLFSLSANAQNAGSAELQKERYEEKVEENKQKYIADFLVTLEVDDFQKEIIKQTMDTYFDEVVKLQKMGFKSYEFKDALVKMRISHFADVRAIVSEDTMKKIEDALTGEWSPKDEKKKKRKRNRKNEN